MKIQLLALPLVGLMASGALAQTPTVPAAPKAPTNATIDPAAKTLLDRATATYKDVSGLSFKLTSLLNGKPRGGVSDARFSRPNLFAIEQGSGDSLQRLLVNSTDLYLVSGTTYRKQAAPPIGAEGILGGIGTAGSLLSAMLQGKNPVTSTQSGYAGAPFQGFQSRTIALAPRVIDGDTLSGVQTTYSFKVPGSDKSLQTLSNQTTMWFGGSPLMLRRVQAIYTQNGKSSTLTEKLTDQQLSPTFTADTFKFNDTGLKLASAEDEAYFDPRLKTGAEPLAFEAKGLDGATITPAKYKGKVLLMDFWATWCGPCVASLPELKGAYDKYHAKGLEVVGVSLDEDKSALTSFIKQKQMPWPQIFDGKGWNAAVPGIYGVKAIPFMLIIGKDGKIAAVNPRGNIEAAVKAALAAN